MTENVEITAIITAAAVQVAAMAISAWWQDRRRETKSAQYRDEMPKRVAREVREFGRGSDPESDPTTQPHRRRASPSLPAAADEMRSTPPDRPAKKDP